MYTGEARCSRAVARCADVDVDVDVDDDVGGVDMESTRRNESRIFRCDRHG